MQMIYLLHSQPDDELARRLRRRFPSVFGSASRRSESSWVRRTFDRSISMEDILEDLHYGRAA